PLCRHVRQPTGVQRPGRRFYDGNRFDTRIAAGAKRDGQLCQGRAAVTGPHRTRRLRPEQEPAVRRHVGGPLRLHQPGAFRSRRREIFASSRNSTANYRSGSKSPGRKEMTAAALSPTGSRVANPWLVAAVVVVPTFMEVLDTTIAVVALRYIAGGLSATVDDGEWVLTSYLAANAMILPITGWLSAHLGRRNYFLASIALFTLSSFLCGIAGSLEQLILFRVMQGLAGGGLQPSSQGVLLDALPPDRQGTAMPRFGFPA